AADEDPVTSDLSAFLDMVANHIDWYSDSKTWFLSTFSDSFHAWNWAEQRLKKGKVTIYKIDTTKLPASKRLFSMGTL
ncbi:hypothetical protein B0T18DRAFT_300868, partial [Schizothecium vesticola]